MQFYSPLRYPGGKNRLAKFLALVCEKNKINGHYVEPYAGGASVALYLLINSYIKEITINDYDRAIYAFWYAILNNTERFCKKIIDTEVSVENWHKFRIVYSDKKNASLFNLGFATFFLNRTCRSGILDSGVIGGKNQKGKYKIDCRFNKKELIKRIKLIGSKKNHIHLNFLDALELIKKIQSKPDRNTIYYFDPPYFLKGPALYMNYYKEDDHKEVSIKIKEIKNSRWIVSYDNVSKINKLYKGLRKLKYKIPYIAHTSREGKEILFFSNNLLVPAIINPAQI